MIYEQRALNILYTLVTLSCLFLNVSPALALFTGLAFAFKGLGNKLFSSRKSFILQASIVLMGFGMSLNQAIEASKTSFLLTALTVTFTLLAGLFMGKVLRVDKKTSVLIASGTAICGGSAIAAIAPVIEAEDNQITFSLAVVFTLNAIALLIFPPIGHYYNMSQEMFGYWSAISIHDTSSVVGAGATYGPAALEIATIIKLTRALWIIPLSIVILFFRRNDGEKRINPPWFIGLFLAAIVLAHLLPEGITAFATLNWLGKRGMVIALFLIGSNMSFSQAREAGGKSFLLGILLWLFVGTFTMLLLKSHFNPVAL
ncbi:MAG: hypothetical protein PWR01_3726 [Clostridiales bacterium]|jgi:uncharacterized integral membrane protein (TIGR00698 family)|nr:hypothetical protein [Clostridiales bacterium]MDN5282653.1 hypothetical protein [Candidatus Ozemobacter sp.]